MYLRSCIFLCFVQIVLSYSFDNCSLEQVNEFNETVNSDYIGVIDTFNVTNILSAKFLNNAFFVANLTGNTLTISTTSEFVRSGVGLFQKSVEDNLQIICMDNSQHDIPYKKVFFHKPIRSFERGAYIYDFFMDIPKGYIFNEDNPYKIKNYDTVPNNLKFILDDDIDNCFEIKDVRDDHNRTYAVQLSNKKEIIGADTKMVIIAAQDEVTKKNLSYTTVYVRVLKNAFTQSVYTGELVDSFLVSFNGDIQLSKRYDHTLTTFRITSAHRGYFHITQFESKVLLTLIKDYEWSDVFEVLELEAVYNNETVIAKTSIVIFAKANSTNNISVDYMLFVWYIFLILLTGVALLLVTAHYIWSSKKTDFSYSFLK